MKLQWARRVRPHDAAGREETVMKALSALVELGSADHERFLRAAQQRSAPNRRGPVRQQPGRRGAGVQHGTRWGQNKVRLSHAQVSVAAPL